MKLYILIASLLAEPHLQTGTPPLAGPFDSVSNMESFLCESNLRYAGNPYLQHSPILYKGVGVPKKRALRPPRSR